MPYEITNFSIAFTAAMQFNTFERAHGMGMATPFCTNHVKQASANFVRFLRNEAFLTMVKFPLFAYDKARKKL